MRPVIVITGGTGLIGRALTGLLVRKQYRVHILTRQPERYSGTDTVSYFAWDWTRRKIDGRVFEDATTLVHLAGANIGAQRWTENYKAQIAGSRILSLAFLRDFMMQNGIRVQYFAGASAIGYYGCVTDDRPRSEADPPGTDFLARLTVRWEQTSQSMKAVAAKVGILRTGVVFDKREGAFPRMIRPLRWGITSPLGTGRQWIDWIHIHDIARMYLFMLENAVEGTFNAVAPDPLTYRQFVQTTAAFLRRPCCLPPVPGFLVRWLTGPSACLALEGMPIESDKIRSAGFEFHYPQAEDALRDLSKV